MLAVLDGTGIRQVARDHACSPKTVRKWWRRWCEGGIAALGDAPRSGRPALYDDSTRRDLLALATAQAPAPFAGWSHERLSAAMGELNWGVSPSWVGRALKRLDLKVHQVRGWVHRRADPDFNTRVAAVEAAVTAAGDDPFPVLCLDEKTSHPLRVPVLPDSRDGRGRRRREFEYVRHGTISWYGIQTAASGAVQMIRSTQRMDSVAFIEVLEHLVAVHGSIFTLVMDNGPAHTSYATRTWLQAHPGISVRLTPKHASWVNPVESVFGILTRQVLQHATFVSAEDCDGRVQHWTRLRNQQHRPVTFTWQRPGAPTSAADH
ncbi:transposase [Kineococcus rhizosphaerae]|uniref:Transposase n=1 Tax=Kineococcus rhizosphaerae TaxID=559628 RepID=A0A2T0QH70_9ACTN|nr:transposase [Kineococcus rhizosphaerae]